MLGGIGGIVSGEWPAVGAVMMVLGSIGALWDHFSSEIQSKEVESLFEAQAILLANKGIGNLYTEAGKHELNNGLSNRAIERFQKALAVDANDKEALCLLGAMLAIELGSEQWPKLKKEAQFRGKIKIAKECAEKGKRMYPRDHRFYDVLGIIFDIEGDHENARAEFRQSGALRSDPFWHLLLATSWGMSGNDKEGLAEMRRAIKKGAKYWLVDFYYGRALGRYGDYDKALPELEKAFKARRWHVQVLREIADVHYFEGHFREAAKFAALCGIALLGRRPGSGIRQFGWAVHHILLYWTLGVSKMVRPISRRIPILNWVHLKLCPPDAPEAALAETLLQQGHYRFAEKHLRRACEVLPNSPWLLANLSTCLSIQGKKSEAIEICDRAIRLASREPLLSQLKRHRITIASNEPKRIVTVKYPG